jgi:hypothetical protein
LFWTRHRREARRQQVLDELLALGPAERLGRLDQAVVAGDVRADEVDSALRLVGRLDALRVMTVPPSSRLPGGIAPITERRLARVQTDPDAADDSSPSSLSVDVSEAGDIAGVGEPEVDAADPADTRERSRRSRVASTARSGRRSSRRRRARAAADLPAEGEIEIVPETPESWPSIEWLRP